MWNVLIVTLTENNLVQILIQVLVKTFLRSKLLDVKSSLNHLIYEWATLIADLIKSLINEKVMPVMAKRCWKNILTSYPARQSQDGNDVLTNFESLSGMKI